MSDKDDRGVKDAERVAAMSPSAGCEVFTIAIDAGNNDWYTIGSYYAEALAMNDGPSLSHGRRWEVHRLTCGGDA